MGRRVIIGKPNGAFIKNIPHFVCKHPVTCVAPNFCDAKMKFKTIIGGSPCLACAFHDNDSIAA